jgi:hypothetical protein
MSLRPRCEGDAFFISNCSQHPRIPGRTELQSRANDRMNLLGRKILVIGLTVVLSVVLIIGLNALMMRPLYTSQVPLTTSYNKPYENKLWISANFNDSNGNGVSWFSFTLRSNNQSRGPIWITASFGPIAPGQYSPYTIDSVTMTFSSDQFGYFVDVGARVSAGTGSLSPVTLTRGDQATEIMSYDNLGLYGLSNNRSDFWLWLSGMSSQSGNHTVTIRVDMIAHDSQNSLMGHSYSAEAIFLLTVQPNGLISVSDK